MKDFQQKFELTVTAQGATSTDGRFTMDDLSLGDNYRPLDVYMERADGTRVERRRRPNERRFCNQTMPKLAFQVFEEKLKALSPEKKESFPVCRYRPEGKLIQGIYSEKKGYGYLTYVCEDGGKLSICCWNIFSTIHFVQACLEQFGDAGDKFVLTYREATPEEKDRRKKQKREQEDPADGRAEAADGEPQNPYSKPVTASGNVIFRGAPGTGKTYLARSVAADIVSGGRTDRYDELTEEEKSRVGFVQFHPSYDYTDFVEGLRPRLNADGSMGFELRDGVFKDFVDRAREEYEAAAGGAVSVKETVDDFLADTEAVKQVIHAWKQDAKVERVDAEGVVIRPPVAEDAAQPPEGQKPGQISLYVWNLWALLETDERLETAADVQAFLMTHCGDPVWEDPEEKAGYYFALCKAIRRRRMPRSYVFIIDEINRGEISKIFGELFFSVDPGYRGKAGEVFTQYANLHAEALERFYIPENVYIIGTMNDIDRSVDTFDFAMRRRFRFIELKAEDRVDMLDALGDKREDALRRMTALNREILRVEGLNENYQIGPAYFLKLKTLTPDRLWTDYLHPLLRDYVQGMYDEKTVMEGLERAYFLEEAR